MSTLIVAGQILAFALLAGCAVRCAVELIGLFGDSVGSD